MPNGLHVGLNSLHKFSLHNCLSYMNICLVSVSGTMAINQFHNFAILQCCFTWVLIQSIYIAFKSQNKSFWVHT